MLPKNSNFFIKKLTRGGNLKEKEQILSSWNVPAFSYVSSSTRIRDRSMFYFLFSVLQPVNCTDENGKARQLYFFTSIIYINETRNAISLLAYETRMYVYLHTIIYRLERDSRLSPSNMIKLFIRTFIFSKLNILYKHTYVETKL